MSSQVATRPAGGSSAARQSAPPTPAPAPGARSGWGTPARLRVALTTAVLAGLLLAVPGLLGFQMRAGAVDSARDEASHLVTVQTGRTRLLTADALAVTTVLTGDPAGTTQVNHYGYAVQEAVLRLAAAARGDDQPALASAAAGAQRYARDVEVAQQLSRAAGPGLAPSPGAGADRLRGAQGQVRAVVLPRLDGVGTASRDRLDGDLGAAADARVLVVVVLAVVLVLLALVQVWLARRTRRVVNPGLALATVATLLVAGVALTVLARSTRAADTARSSTAPVVSDVVDAQLAIFQARSDEGLALLRRAREASPAQLESRWQSDVARARAALQRVPADLAAGPLAQLRVYEKAHTTVRDALTADRGQAAVDAAVDPSDTGTAGSAENLDVSTSVLLTRQVSRLDDELADAAGLLRLTGWLCLVAGVAVAVLGWRSVGRRLAEYR